MAVIVEKQLSAPVLQVVVGKFLSNYDSPLIATLHPRGLAYHRLVTDTEESFKLDKIFEHKIRGSPAFNMCQGNFGRSYSEQICIQSLNCTLSIYEGENHVLTREISQAIHPGPIQYTPYSESMLTGSGGYLSSIRYNVLTAASTSAQGKKLNTDWTLNLGDTALDIAVMGILPIQPSILVLCKRALYCMTHGGTPRFIIRLQCAALCLMVYNSVSDAGIQLCIGTSTKTLLFYHDTTVVWSAQMPFSPVSVTISSFGEANRCMLTSLSDDCRVSVGFLGTEPSLFRMPVTESRYIDFEKRKKELREFEDTIRKSAKEGQEANKEDAMTVSASVAIDSQSAPTVSVNISGSLEPLQLIFEGGIHAHQSIFSCGRDVRSVPITVFVRDNPVLDPRCNVIAVCTNGETAEHELRLPLRLICHEAVSQRTAQLKFTVDSSEEAVELNKLFPEFESDSQTSLGLQPFGAPEAVVSIFVSLKANRYRIQSDSVDFVYAVFDELVQRIRKAQPNAQLRCAVPMHMFISTIVQKLETEKQREKESENVSRLSVQMRHVETVLLRKMKSERGESTSHVNALVNYTYRELLVALDRLSAIDAQMSPRGLQGLRSLLNLMRSILALSDVQLPFDGRILDANEQKISERLGPLLSSSSDAANTTWEPAEIGRLFVEFCERGGNLQGLAEIPEEDEEEAEEEADQTEKGFEFTSLQTGSLQVRFSSSN
ncbi:hypothetical protein AAVH_04727 [Aphelenchoides avenae]|nr:hypothetical protein AAVH_04727 [Aphelenchus avenae]